MIEQQPTVIEPTPPGTVVSLSDAAVAKLNELTKEETNPDIGLRVYVYSGGCSGFGTLRRPYTGSVPTSTGGEPWPGTRTGPESW